MLMMFFDTFEEQHMGTLVYMYLAELVSEQC
jgi:hypothetical protein